MFILDFLFYYLTYWFDKNKVDLSWSSPIERAEYAIGLATVAVIYSINQFLIFQNIISEKFQIPKLIFLVIALLIMKLYDFIYVTNKRYQKITSNRNQILVFNENIGMWISMAIVAICILSPFIVITIFVPFGSKK
jgi:phosphatidylglycerophosphatase A